jgi:hypothetical protein
VQGCPSAVCTRGTLAALPSPWPRCKLKPRMARKQPRGEPAWGESKSWRVKVAGRAVGADKMSWCVVESGAHAQLPPLRPPNLW